MLSKIQLQDKIEEFLQKDNFAVKDTPWSTSAYTREYESATEYNKITAEANNIYFPFPKEITKSLVLGDVTLHVECKYTTKRDKENGKSVSQLMFIALEYQSRFIHICFKYRTFYTGGRDGYRSTDYRCRTRSLYTELENNLDLSLFSDTDISFTDLEDTSYYSYAKTGSPWGYSDRDGFTKDPTKLCNKQWVERDIKGDVYTPTLNSQFFMVMSTKKLKLTDYGVKTIRMTGKTFFDVSYFMDITGCFIKGPKNKIESMVIKNIQKGHKEKSLINKKNKENSQIIITTTLFH